MKTITDSELPVNREYLIRICEMAREHEQILVGAAGIINTDHFELAFGTLFLDAIGLPSDQTIFDEDGFCRDYYSDLFYEMQSADHRFDVPGFVDKMIHEAAEYKRASLN